MYVAAPVSAILYQCQVTGTDIPYEYDDGKIHMNHVMKVKCLQKYAPTLFPLSELKKYGVFAVRGPRSMPIELLDRIRSISHEQ